MYLGLRLWRWGANRFVIGLENHFFDVFPHLLIERMCDVFEGSIFSFFCGHRDEESCSSENDFEVSHDESVLEGDRGVGFEFVLVGQKYLDLCYSDVHQRCCSLPSWGCPFKVWTSERFGPH